MFGPDYSPEVTRGVAQIYTAALEAIASILPANPEVKRTAMALVRETVKISGIEIHDDFLTTALSLSTWDAGELIWTINKKFLNPQAREVIATLIARRICSIAAIAPAAPNDAALAFARDGIIALTHLVSSADAKEMLGYFQECHDTQREDSLVYHKIRDVVRAPHVFRIATDERLLAIASAHISAPATVVQMDAWWSTAESGEATGSQIFHRDRDDFKACKLFLYLTDVGPDTGPHVFVRGSHRLNAVASVLTAKADISRLGDYFAGDARTVAGRIEDTFGSAVTEITGPPATSFLENTYGFHRGKVPVAGSRCVFQVTYAAIPYPFRVEQWKNAGLSALPQDCAMTPQAVWATRCVLAGTLH